MEDSRPRPHAGKSRGLLLPAAHLGPGVAQADRAVEHQRARLGVRVAKKIAWRSNCTASDELSATSAGSTMAPVSRSLALPVKRTAKPPYASRRTARAL